MPNVGVLNLNTPRPANQALGQSIGQYLDLAGDREVERRDSAALEKIYNKYRGDQDMIQKTFQAIQTNPEISNHKKVSAVKDLLDLEKYNTDRLKETNAQLKAERDRAAKAAQVRQIEQSLGKEPGSLSAFDDNPSLAYSVNKPQKQNQASQPIEQDQLKKIQQVREMPEFKKATPAGKYQLLTNNGVSKENADVESKLYADEAKQNQSIFEADRDYHSKVSAPVIAKANQTVQSYEIEKGLNEQLRKDIQSGNTSGLFPFIVDNLGLNSFKNPETARFTNEIKNKFVSSLRDIPGARPNQFIERFLSTAQPLIGQSEEANLSVIDLDEFVKDLRFEQAKQELQIAKEDRKNFGYVKEDVSERARERMGDYVNRRQEKMALDIQNRSEENKKDVDLLNEIIGKTVIPGSYVTPRIMKLLYIRNDKDLNKALQEAKSLQMRLPEYAAE